MTTTILDQKEINERKNWLKLTFFQFVLYPFGIFLFFAVLSLSEKILLSEGDLEKQLFSVLGGLIHLWIIWHCAYEKHGTKLLTTVLVLMPVRFLNMVASVELWDLWLVGLFILDFSVYALWYIFALKLRKINKKIQDQSGQDYEEFMQSLKSSQSILILDEQFLNLISKWPQFEKRATKEYELRKSELSTTPSSG